MMNSPGAFSRRNEQCASDIVCLGHWLYARYREVKGVMPNLWETEKG